MGKERMEVFSDGVLAIIITIMVLELRPPHDTEPAALRPLLPVLLSYVLSFVFLGLYWNNHHHMLSCTRRVTGAILWANLHLLFWLSLVPFVTAWMGEHPFASTPAALYGVVLVMAGIAYLILQRQILRSEGPESVLAAALGRDRKGRLAVRRGDRYCVHKPGACLCAVSAGRARVAHSRSADRAGTEPAGGRK
jgi:uncharacterized membrane protein